MEPEHVPSKGTSTIPAEPPPPPPVVFHPPNPSPPPTGWDSASLPISTISLPPLPVIKNESIRNRVFRHKSSVALVQEDHSPVALELNSYRPLEFVGDGIMRHLVGEALFVRFPRLTSGGLSILRDKIVRNCTLSHLAWYYGFESHIHATTHQPGESPLNHVQDVLADVFEAYAAGVRQEANFREVEQGVEDWIRMLVTPNVFTTLDDEAAALLERASAPKKRPREIGPQADLRITKARTMVALRDPASACRQSHDIPDHRLGLLWIEQRPSSGSVWHVTAVVDGRIVGCGEGNAKQSARDDAMVNVARTCLIVGRA